MWCRLVFLESQIAHSCQSRRHFALVDDLVAIQRPHIDILKRDVSERDYVGASNDNWAARDAVVDITGPILEMETAQGDSAGVRG